MVNSTDDVEADMLPNKQQVSKLEQMGVTNCPDILQAGSQGAACDFSMKAS